MHRLGLTILLVAISASAAGEQWTRLTTPHFEMYTTGSKKRSRETILYFEEIRSFFLKAAAIRTNNADFPVRVVAFKTPKQYEPYSPNTFASAFYVPGRSRDYIVMGDMDPEHLPVAIHEYTHLLINHTGLKLPVWLNEGLADVYSTLKPLGAKAMIGDLIPGRVQTLQSVKWLPFDVLTAVSHDSPIYKEKQRAGIFYSESWALTHMLYLAPSYHEHFADFLRAVKGGVAVEDACKTAFGKSGAQVYKDLQTYLSSNRLFGAVFDVKLTKSEEDAAVAQPDEFESALVSADLLATMSKFDRAKAEYEALAAKYPTRAEVPHSLGYLAWQRGQRDEATLYFEKAFDAGTKDPQMCYHLGIFERQAGKTKERAIPAFQRAIELDRNYIDARLELGLAQLQVQEYQAALVNLGAIHNIDPERASRLFNGLGYAFANTGNLQEAKKNAELAQKWNRNDEDKRQTEQLLDYLSRRITLEARSTSGGGAVDRASANTENDSPHLARKELAAPGNPFVAPGEKVERMEGTARSLNCAGDTVSFSIQSGNRIVTFDMPQPDRIQLKHNGDVTFDFICGPQKPFPIAVEYVPAAQPGGKPRASLE